MRYLLLGLLLLFMMQMVCQPVCADEQILVEYFYNENCGSCLDLLPLFDEVEAEYDDVVVVLKQYDEYLSEYEHYKAVYRNSTGSIIGYPFAVISRGEMVEILPYQSINMSNVERIVNGMVVDKDVIEFDVFVWEVRIDLNELSLPVLTVILAGVDSFNPCVFFILVFLLNMLLYARSRKRMLLIGSVFIVFSAVLYFVFMVLMLQAVQLTVEAGITGVVVGGIALVLGGINIKDFFFHKKGVSISIPESKKPNIYKRMRGLLKHNRISGVLLGTVVLAVLVNSYELVCSLTMPTLFLSRVALAELPVFQTYMYLVMYNVIYVIPMIVIVLFFIFTLGKRKMSQWQGRLLQLFSGIMMASFGVLFVIDVTILENVMVPVLILGFTLVATGVIAEIWQYVHKQHVGSGELDSEDAVDDKDDNVVSKKDEEEKK